MVVILMKLLLDLFVCFFPDLESRPSALSRPAHILNIDIADNHEDAMLGAIVICEICEMVIGLVAATSTVRSASYSPPHVLAFLPLFFFAVCLFSFLSADVIFSSTDG